MHDIYKVHAQGEIEMRQLSKAYKAEHFDSVEAERNKLSLALYDLINDKFSKPVKVRAKDYEKDGTCTLTMRASWRGMPLFLVEWNFAASESTQFEVYTESQMEDIARSDNHGITAYMMLRDAYWMLRAAFISKAA